MRDISASLEDLCLAIRRHPPGDQLREVRLALEVSQKVLADSANVPQSTVSRMEAGGDALLSTWIRVLAGLGGEVRFVFPDLETVTDVQQDTFLRKCRREDGLAKGWGKR